MGATDKYPPIRPGGSLMLAWQIRGKPVLIIGGGNVAAGRLTNILEADAKVTLIAPRFNLHPEILHRLSSLPPTQLVYKDKHFEPSDLTDEYAMVLTAIDSPADSTQIWKLCKERRIPVNVADVPSECDFYFGSQHRDGPLQIMISTNGSAPKLANLLRVRVAESLPVNAGRGCLNVGKLRRKLRGIAPGSAEGPKRMKWMIDVCEQFTLDELVSLDDGDMDRLLQHYKEGRVPPYGVVRGKTAYTFDGSFGWHC